MLDRMIALADQCLADYDENGWRDPAWLNSDSAAQISHTPESPA
jgi:hypothetical protein